ncbi:HesA/MoeB/ThiF family protein [Actinomadura latina]|uniref:ThiF family adenylyltransferase n=1 Tax=Actinomadura latina TaxID=163603 RepID=A0A846YR36_9ACTN|nr:ThiF family adenylyltransferase [Actinomadura latina]NKZ03260.1 ThiF family adenylyltransferase [Actinomadura latina]
MTEALDADRHDRQVRAFGQDGQHKLRSATAAVVGVGGIGSLLVQGLAHLGIGRLIIVDPDHVEATNLNRLTGATPTDVCDGTSKVEVAARAVERIDPNIPVHALQDSILDTDVWMSLRCADLIFGAVDGHAPRWALNSLAVQYARPYIDTGAEITTNGSNPLDVSGHVATVTPGGPCLLCLSGYDPTAASMELDPVLTTAKRSAGYLHDAPDEPTPSVIFLNQAIAGIALGEALNLLTGWHRPRPRPYTLIDLAGPALTAIDADPQPDCPACGLESPRGEGDATPPPHFSTPTPPPRP